MEEREPGNKGREIFSGENRKICGDTLPMENLNTQLEG